MVGGDCADTDADRNPGEPEVCSGKDDDYDAATDPDSAGGCSVRYKDSDDDGYGEGEDQRCLCAVAAPYGVTATGDCDDQSAAAAPTRPRCATA
ncbi:MAG: hypothetical protein U1F43_11940 [Myxococcota bacterium]